MNSAYEAVACSREEADAEGMFARMEAETTGGLVWNSTAEGEYGMSDAACVWLSALSCILDASLFQRSALRCSLIFYYLLMPSRLSAPSTTNQATHTPST